MPVVAMRWEERGEARSASASHPREGPRRSAISDRKIDSRLLFDKSAPGALCLTLHCSCRYCLLGEERGFVISGADESASTDPSAARREGACSLAAAAAFVD